VALIIEAGEQAPDDEVERVAAAHLNNRAWRRLMR
jgi:hypothetical protein